MGGLFVTFEGTEGSGKSTQIELLARRLAGLNRTVLTLREPGGTPLGEEIRRLLKHSAAGDGMFPETELLLMNASRAQLVREVIRPALARGEIVLCDRYFDSTIAYQVYGRNLGETQVRRIIDFAIGPARPDLTLLLRVPLQVSEARRASRGAEAWTASEGIEAAGRDAPAEAIQAAAGCEAPDRFEREDRAFFERVEKGYDAVAAGDPARVHGIDATPPAGEVHEEIWRRVKPLVCREAGP